MDNFAFGMFTEEEEYTARQECNAYHDMLDHECDHEFFELSEECDIRRGRRVSDEEAQDRYDEAMRYLDKQIDYDCDISDYEDNYLSGEEDFA